MKMRGGCLCGLVRYQCDQAPVLQFNCHCRDCQKSSGGPFSPIAFFPANSVIVTGEIKYFESVGGSGKKNFRGFCPTCGSQIFGKVEILPALLSIRAGTLDEPSHYTPKAHIYVSHAAHWDHLDTSLTAFAEAAPQR